MEGNAEDINARIMGLVDKTSGRSDQFKQNPRESGTPRELA